jgi:single-stranded DNA-binding protein
MIEGRLVHRDYEKEGSKRYVTEIHVNDFLMLGGPNDKKEK